MKDGKEKGSQEQAEKPHGLYSEILKNMNEGVNLVRLNDGSIVYTNPKLEMMLGYDPGELIGEKISIVNAPTEKTPEEISEEIIGVIHKEGIWRGEVKNIRKDGTAFWCFANVSLFDHSEYGKVLVSVQSDITKRKKAEDALKASEKILGKIFETTHFHVVLLDSKCNFIRVNKAYADTCGFEPDYFIGKNHFDLYPSEELENTFLHVVRTGDPYTVYARPFTFPNQPERGITYWDLAVYPVKNDSEKVKGLLFTLLEITERKLAEEKLRESEEFIRAVMDHLPIGVAVNSVDPVVDFNYMNDNFYRFYRTTRKALTDPDAFWNSVYEDSKFREDIKKRVLDDCASGDPNRMHWEDVPITRKGEATVFICARNIPVPGKHLMISTVWDITERKKAEIQLKKAFEEINKLKEQLEAENVYLREEVKLQHEHGEIVGESDAIKGALKLVEQVAGTGATVLILGETGTGKELLAQSIHNLSTRKGRPMIKVNCAAIPLTLIESELFGREKGAYTGAMTTQVGRFEVANGSTLFLDEIGELSSELQVKLLRVLQDGSLERLGSTKTIKVNVRIIAATNRDIEQAVVDGEFRSDLYYRLNVFPISVPPLRERYEDILPLLWSFVREFEKKMGKQIESIPKNDINALQSYSWPGNVREMKNLIERSMILTSDSILHIEMPQISESGRSRNRTLDEIQKDHIISVLERTEWRVSGENGAAKILGLKPTTLDARMKKLGIKRKK